MREHSTSSNGRIWIGIILILLGSIFIFDNTGLLHFDFSDWLFRWQIILIIIGIIILLNERGGFTGVLLILIGGVFLFADIYDYSVKQIIRDYWPVLLILIGLVILFGRGGSSHRRRHIGPNSTLDDDYIDITSIFSSSRKIIKSQKFKGGKSTTIFGGPEIDLRSSNLAEGEQVLDIVTIFGGTDILVPKDWRVTVKVISIFGGFEDKRFRDPSINYNEGRVLVVKGIVIFGGGEIKS